MEPKEKQAVEFDRDAFVSLADEFGGLAGWWVKDQDGNWSQDRWDEAMARLWSQRHKLEGIEGQKQRGYVALQAFSEGESQKPMCDRIEKLLAELPSAA